MPVADVTDLAALLLLADGRFPVGGHAHSGGVEAAVTAGRVHDLGSLADHLDGRLNTVALVDAALAAATVVRLSNGAADPSADCERPDVALSLRALDAEADVRIAVAGLRAASRKLGRQLLRVAGRCWPHPVMEAATSTDNDRFRTVVRVGRPSPVQKHGMGGGLHASIALGAAGVAAGLDAPAVAALSVHHAITTPAQAAVRLLGLDPFAVAALTAGMAGAFSEVVERAVAAAVGPLADLPAMTAVRSDLDAEAHLVSPYRLFAT